MGNYMSFDTSLQFQTGLGNANISLDERVHSRVSSYENFYESQQPGDLMIVIHPSWVSNKIPFEYNFERGGHLQMAADMLASAAGMLDESTDLDDDLIPWLVPDFGIAIHHAFLVDLPIQFAEWTSRADHPFAGDEGYQRIASLQYDPANPWVQRFIEMHHYWREHGKGRALMITHQHYSPLDLANALRGNELFVDFYDCPQQVHQLLGICADAIASFEDDLRKVIGQQVEQIGVPLWGALAPRGSVFVSEDVMNLVGPELASEFGLPWTRKLQERFGTLTVHHHMLGRRVHGVVGQETHGSLVLITNDPNCPPAMERLEEPEAASGDNARMLDCSAEEILSNIDRLKMVRAVLICGTRDREMANRVVQAVRSVSNIQYRKETRNQ